MPGATPSQPGWYPDHDGLMRWYDGTAWTDHVQPGSGGLADPTVAGTAGPTPTQPLGHYPDGPGWQGGPPPSGPHTTPPPSPPSGQPLTPYGAVPQPSFPGGPGGPEGPGPGGPPFQPSSGGSNKALLIVLAVVGAIVLIAVLSVGAWAVFLRDDDGDGGGGNDGGGGGDNGSLPEPGPAEVVQAFFDAAEAGDCQAALDLVSENFIEENDANCDDPEDFMEDVGEFEAEIGEATIDEEADPPTAVVPVTLTVPEFGEEELPFHMVVEDDEWKIDAVEEEDDDSTDGASPSASVPEPTFTDFSIPTDLLTDLPSGFPTDFPTDPSELESYFSEFLTQTP